MKKNIKRELNNKQVEQLEIDNNKNKISKTSFNMLEVIVIMIITIIITTTIVIKVSYSINNTKDKIVTDAELLEFKDTYNTIVKEYYDDIDKKELIASAIEGMVDYLDDPYSVYMSEDETESYTEELKGEYVGIGTEVSLQSDDSVIIRTVFENSPAKKAGIKVNDIITKVSGESVKGKNITDISNMIKGKSGTKVDLTIIREKKEMVITVERGTVDLPSVSSKVIESNGQKIGYINIDVFASNSYEQFVQHEKELEEKKVKALIVDLRWNTGGYLTTAHSIAELFLDKDDIIYQLDTKGNIKKVKSTEDKKIKLKVAVLVNKSTASASEILTAALKENVGADIIGVKTYGKGKVQKTRMLSTGAMVKYTIQNWLTPTGEQIDGKGITPTLEVELSDKYYKNATEENDNQLKKAIEILCK